MKPRLRVVLTTLAGVAIVAALILNRRASEPDHTGGEVVAVPHESPPPAPVPPAPAALVTLPIAESAGTLNSSATTAEDDISTLDLVFSQYQKQFGGNPVGENEEIAAALLGRNPKHLAFLPVSGAFLDSTGRLIDRWGTPYFFHAISGHHMEIISAGPDRTLHTPDDLRSEW